jgi:5-methylcytosine-specific restriction protein A
MPPRPCLDCGTPAQDTRCPTCKAANDNTRYARRGTTAQRGLAGNHARISGHYKDTHAPCACNGECGRHNGTCGRQGTPENPITAGHIVPRARGGTNDPTNYQPECRSCNSAKQAGHPPHPTTTP